MPVPDEQDRLGPQQGRKRQLWPRRWRTRIALGLSAAALLGGSVAWVSRERIAGDVIDGYLAEAGVAATYDISALTPQVQVIENLVIGDPARPDLTVRRIVIEMGVGWAGPEVRRIEVEGARLFAAVRGGTFSLGALDPLVFTGSDEPPALPALNVALRDARALIITDYGRVGVKLDGAGRLDDGFAGTLAATAPGIGTPGCRADTATLYGQLTSRNGAPELAGPLRLTDLVCGTARLARADIGTQISVAPDFAAADADVRLAGERASFANLSGAAVSGTARIGWSPGRLALNHDLTVADVAVPQARFARLTAEGSWSGAADVSSGQWDGTLRAAGLAPAAGFTASLGTGVRGLEGTLLAPLLSKARISFDRALMGASLRADATVRHKGSAASLNMPEASLATRSGTRVLALSRISARFSDAGLAGLGGNLLAGGAGLPSINGRIEQAAGGGWTLRAAMADYAAGANRLAIPRLVLRGLPTGAFAFDGLVTASGDLPGGNVSDLTVPLEGTWSQTRGLAAGTRCTAIGFAKLALSGLALEGRSVNLCPDGQAPLLAYRDNLTFAARTGPLDLTGRIGENPAQLSASSVVLRYPQPFAIQNLAARIGSGSSEVRLAAANLTGTLGGAVAGAFAGGSARLAAVPLDLDGVTGSWAFTDGALRLDGGTFVLSDRPAQGTARFVPLVAQGASLILADNRITADATLRHQPSGRAVAAVTIRHDLDTAAGSARLSVPGLLFDKALQPDELTPLAKGVIAFADGTITGEGRVDWRGDSVTSGGTFGSDRFDFAAAFGPVRGLAGKVVFTDLINLTTAPDQTLNIAAINPGVEVLAGTVRFDLKDAVRLSLKDARFPFMGGTLVMRPLVMDFSQPEERRYIFDINGLDAAQFVAQMELTNLSATGVFDGTVPIVFDASGRGRIAGGVLTAREGGGNVAYIGELTYEDLGTMGNYAFEALRSLDYRQMRVGLGGQLDGEIITSFDFDGVRQGAGTSQNFVTRRLAKLPIRFKVNVRSENFFELATMVRSFWNADFIRNPQDVGLFRQENGRLVPGGKPVQPSESDDQP
ncbi:exoprotein [Porphyrobacter sp. TH134]|uniref:intermembrane phospholipid transport protein YdbH family protein n=1 Tax=Porphyrobacter sp. TH134 TaxID=2067450 RepID=UPI000C7B0ABB|nr:YdbH domain-containing protein [Porphyrobacter sp. TH134]PLK24899.1 exoprotein [Porphyrobacter sp. TH134]